MEFDTLGLLHGQVDKREGSDACQVGREEGNGDAVHKQGKILQDREYP